MAVQASFQDEVEIIDIRFLNHSEGLAVGYRCIPNQSHHAELFVLGTANGGKLKEHFRSSHQLLQTSTRSRGRSQSARRNNGRRSVPGRFLGK